MKLFFSLLILLVFSIVVFGVVFRGNFGNPTVEVIKQTMNDPIKPHGTTERGRFLLAKNLAENHSFALTREQADAAAPDAGYYNGNWYLLYAPGISIFAAPLYLIGAKYNLAEIFVYGMSFLFSIANLIVIFFIGRKVFKMPLWGSLLASIIYGFASISLSYVSSLYQHEPSVFFLLFGFYSVYQYSIHKKWGFFWAIFVWISYGLAILVDYSNIILMLPVMVYFLASSIRIYQDQTKYKFSFRLSILFTSIFFLLITFAHGYHNKVNLGSWTRLNSSLPGYREGIDKALDAGNQDFQIQDASEKKSGKSPVNFFTEDKIVNGSYILTFAPDKGVFIFSPILLLAFFGIYLACKNINIEMAALLSIAALNIFYYSSWGDPWGGWAFGPRYLMPSIAVLALFTSYWVAFSRYKITARILSFVLFVLSAAIAVVGALTTNGVPPKSEAVYLGIKYSFLFNWDFILNNQTNSVLFNNYLYRYLDVKEYFYAIVALIAFIAVIVLFIFPLFEKGEKKV